MMISIKSVSAMRKHIKFCWPALLLAALASCDKTVTSEEDITQAPGTDGKTVVEYAISFNASDIKTKVVYSDDIKDPVNTDGDGSFTMDWKEGDEVVAIRWPETLNTPPTDWFTLVAKRDGATAKILFECNRASFPATNPLRQGERFVLVHGDFSLGDANDKASLSFPIARLKLPYSDIHHGGTKTSDGKSLLFEGQDGSLDCLSRHEFMVTDAYANIIADDADYANPDVKGLVQLTKAPIEEGGYSEEPIKLSSVNTIIRLQAFVPDTYFTGEREGEKIQAMSISTADKSPVFYRYFRMHPNEQEDDSSENRNYWLVDANRSSECNPYLRVNIGEGFSPMTDNALQDQLVSNAYVNSKGVAGRLVTAYFAIPSKSFSDIRAAGDKELKVCVFTDTHAYKTKKTYTISKEALRPGSVIPMSINFMEELVDDIDADTDGNLGVTFAPGFVYAEKQDDGSWNYGIYEHQGQYAGMSRQSLDFGEFFVFGSADPTESYHLAMEDGKEVEKFAANHYKKDSKQDVSELVCIKGVNPFTMPTMQEAERIFEHVMEEGKYCIGYYYYPVNGTGDRTYHLSENAQKAMAAARVPDDGQIYAGSYGIWVGTKTQPAYDKQDKYLFIPDSKQLDSKKSYRASGFEKKDSSGNLYPGGYTLADRGYLYIPGSGWEAEENVLKFSMNTCDEAASNGMCYRIQFWYRKGSGFESTNVKEMDVTFGRPVRGVIF